MVASDFEHTIKRVINLESGGSPFYLGIVGAEDYLAANDPEADIEGIETDDKTGEITIELVEPDATFSNVLAMNFAGLVPGDTPFKNLTEDPPPGVGPYEITESVPNRQFVMEKVDGFADLGIEGIPAGHVDKMTTSIIKNQTQQAQDVLEQRTGLHAGSAAGRLQADGARAGRSRRDRDAAVRGVRHDLHVLLLHAERPAPVRRPEGPRGGQHRARQAGAGPPLRRRAEPGLFVPAAGHARLRRGARHDRVPVGRSELLG